MTTEDSFLLAVAAAIDDRLPRLAFADWLEDLGDPRAEWLRVGCELAELPPGDGRRPGLEARKQALWDAHRDGLAGWERQFALARIRSKVARVPAEVVRFDPAVHVHGEKLIQSPLRLNPPLGEAEVLAFEAEYRVTLPDEYRLFLRHVGDGGLGPGNGLLRLADAVGRSPTRNLATPFPFSVRQYREDPDRFYDERCDDLRQRRPGVLYLAAPDSDWVYGYLVITGEDRGLVWGSAPSAAAGRRPVRRRTWTTSGRTTSCGASSAGTRTGWTTTCRSRPPAVDTGRDAPTCGWTAAGRPPTTCRWPGSTAGTRSSVRSCSAHDAVESVGV